MTKAERKELEAEVKYWDALADRIGWRLSGWNRKAYATFVSPTGESQHIRAPFRDAIVEALV